MPKNEGMGDIGIESQYKAKTIEEIRQLAMDLLAGQVFASWQIPAHDQHLMPSIFMPLFFVDDLLAKEWERDGIVHVYGHMKDTVMRSINGYPIFHSFGVLDQNDSNRIVNMAKKMQLALNEMDEDGEIPDA